MINAPNLLFWNLFTWFPIYTQILRIVEKNVWNLLIIHQLFSEIVEEIVSERTMDKEYVSLRISMWPLDVITDLCSNFGMG
jgi:hypothetical protein